MIKIINDALVELLGAESSNLENKRPLKIMMIGLHGSCGSRSGTGCGILEFWSNRYLEEIMRYDI